MIKTDIILLCLKFLKLLAMKTITIKRAFQCLIALLIVVSPIFVDQKLTNFWSVFHWLYMSILVISAIAPFIALLNPNFYRDLKDDTEMMRGIVVFFMVALGIFVIPGIFSYHYLIHIFCFVTAEIGFLILFVAMYVGKLVKKHKAYKL